MHNYPFFLILVRDNKGPSWIFLAAVIGNFGQLATEFPRLLEIRRPVAKKCIDDDGFIYIISFSRCEKS